MGILCMDKIKKKSLIIEILVIVFFSFFVGSALVINPFFGDINLIDEGQFGAWANHMLLGKHMYRNILIPYGPFYIYPFYLLFKFLGASAFIVRIILLCMNTIFGILVVNIVLYKLNISRITRWLTLAILLVVPGISIRLGIGLVVFLFTLKSSKSKNILLSFLNGILIASAFLISSEMGITTFFIAVFYYIYIFIVTQTIKLFFKKMLFVILGIIMLFGLFALWSLHEGWFLNYLYTTIDTLSSFSGINSPNGTNFPNPLLTIFNIRGFVDWIKFVFSKDMLLYWEIFLYISALFYLFVVKILNITKNITLIVLITLYGIFSFTILIGRSGHFFFTLPLAIIIGVYFVDKLIKNILKSNVKIEKAFSFFLVIVFLTFLLRIILIFRSNFPKITNLYYLFSFQKDNPKNVGPISISTNQKEYIEFMQNFIWQNTTIDDQIFFLSNEPMMYLLVNRINLTRFDLPYMANTIDKRLEIRDDLNRKLPKYIFQNTKEWNVDEVSNEQRLPEVMEFINNNYSKRIYRNGVAIYKLKNL